MKKVLKMTGIVLGALAVGAFCGWCFQMAGLSAAVSVAIIMAAFGMFGTKVKKSN